MNVVEIKTVKGFTGSVVWSSSKCQPPAQTAESRSAGELLMVIKDDDGTCYRVDVPSSDLRFPRESGFWVYETAYHEFDEVTRRIECEEIECKITELRSSKIKELKASAEKKAKKTIKKEIRDLEKRLKEIKLRGDRPSGKTDLGIETVLHYGIERKLLGYQYALPVKKGDFVLRLQKRRLILADRLQTNDYFNAMKLQQICNVSEPIVTGEMMKEVARLKGRVMLTQVADAIPDTEEDKRDATAWKEERVRVHLYVLTGRNLTNIDTFGKSDPFLEVSMAGKKVVSSKVFNENLNPDFYEHIEMTATIPGDAMLTIAVIDKGALINRLIGKTSIDLEDRWMALRYCKPTDEEIKNPIKEQPTESAVDGKRDDELPPFRISSPLEIMPLHVDESGSGLATGTLRYFIDMVEESEDYREIDLKELYSPTEFELRVIVWKVTDIDVFQDCGQRNDVMIEITLHVRAFEDQQADPITLKTDVHKFAHDTAGFNWRMLFPVKLPAAAVEMKVRMIDCDTIGPHDVIYEEEVVPIDGLCRYSLDRQPRETPAKSDNSGCCPYICRDVLGCCGGGEEIVDGMRRPRGLCPGRRRNIFIKPAKLHLSLQMVPIDQARENPVGQGRKEPNVSPFLPEPQGRVQWIMCIQRPCKFLEILIGRRCCRRLQCSTCTLLCVLLLALLLFVVAQFALASQLLRWG
ncbi:unnamed protein product [Vitrella brassicaformis CCMP3155]|uniref:C2 domain-containing protein n=2 Tax=Vitrella brassicaformis TaxID=1169539 RepID=A0A0G4F2N9_VITBC|nr:unnamed protein product [Vitrella brassicaformis CCMP3155]|eukprot:CEM05827.1 unnamed protein product [Vitrella brassicaformis CCMP3155]